MKDQTIWNNIVSGDVTALRQLHDRYYYQMYLWACKYLGNESEAEELVADCFIKLWNQKQQIIIRQSLKAYLFLMLRNHIISHLRKSKSHMEVGTVRVPDIPDQVDSSEPEFYVKLYRTIEKLPEQRRRILELAVFDALTYKEIARELDISVNTVKTQMARAYRFLKEELDPKDFILFFIHHS
ncbi:MAG TPA: RNA polymerase sigma-70 factor [Sunxiuqinia sp.]|nr:RNA polymerase sigma-70 factor [Sunxiuqinia sp.]